jgi:hypothetical protein
VVRRRADISGETGDESSADEDNESSTKRGKEELIADQKKK